MAEGKRRRVDWDALEPHYRAGIRSLKDIGREFEVSDAGIIRHARENGWTRNLRAKVDAKTREKVSAAVVSAEVSATKKLTEAVRVEVESEVRARLELAQRSDAAEIRNASMALVREHALASANVDALAQIAEVVAAGDPKKMAEALDKALSLPGRAKTLKDAAETAIKAIELERRVNRLDEGDGRGGASEYERMLAEVHAATHP